MPKKVLPDAEEFLCFEKNIIGKGFRPITRQEFTRDFKRLSLVAPRMRLGREIGYVFHANGLDVVVWTTVLAPGYARDEDAGWVVIRDRDRVRYFTHPLHRTEGFLERLWRWAQVAQQRVVKRPLCPECGAFMQITNGRRLKARYWSCDRRWLHSKRKKIALDWDICLSPRALEFVTEERKKREQYRERARAAGKNPGTALRHRKAWKVGRPENLLPP